VISVLRVVDLYFSYGKKPVIEGVTFEVDRGKVCGLFGPNGSGKTTLFKCCLKFLEYQRGTISMNGSDIRGERIEDMARLVAYVPQEHKPSFPYLVKEIVLMGRTPHLRGVFGASQKDKAKAIEALDTLGIKDLADKSYNQLSGGQRQMVLMARAIAQDTPLMFLDEPTSALDFSNQVKIWKTIRKVAEGGVTILACSHDPNFVSWFCDQVTVMKEGKVVADGPPSEVIVDQVLEEIYPEICRVERLAGTRMVLPKELVER
jgi:iron complex transport system ATP-binding protein